MSTELTGFDKAAHRQLCIAAEQARLVAESTSFVARLAHDRWLEAERRAEGYRQRRAKVKMGPAISFEFITEAVEA